ncbi:hypothetical protein VTO42DRAFT_118 [Malbranchea cinnamomea]
MEKRSHDGCWTCRLRRKKCDEKEPICSPCLGLGLTCHRSRQKPVWMDGGAREKAERVRVKMAVAKAVKKRRKAMGAHYRNCNSGPPKSAPEPPSVAGSHTPVELDDPTDRRPTTADPFFFDQSPTEEGSLFNASHETLLFHEPSRTSSSMSDRPPFSSGTAYMTPPESGVGDPVDLSNFTVLWDPSPVLSFDSNCCLQPSLPSMTLQEAALMIHYFENTVQWQFQFLCTSELTYDKAWLLWLMANSRPVYLAALALSASYMKVSGGSTPMGVSADAAGFYQTSAVKNLHQSLECYQAQSPVISPLDDAILILAGITMLLSLNVLQGGDTDWRFHLRAATGLLSQRGDWWTDPSLTGALPDTFPAETNGSFGSVAGDGETALLKVTAAKWIISSIVWFDTMSIFNSESRPTLYDQYIKILSSESSMVSSICENWVLLSILYTNDLRLWKRKARTEGSLSVWALTKRAACIREGLEADIAFTYQWLSQTDNDVEELVSEYLRKITTYIFACAAAVLLETVASGGHPSLPEIQRAVCRTIGALEMFPDADLLRTLVWPLCVAGCLAEPHQYNFFRDLISSVPQSSRGNLQNVMDIIERCWSLRRAEPARPDGVTWEDAMASLGRDILLV